MTRHLSVLGAVAILVLAACGSGDTTGPIPTSTSAAPVAPLEPHPVSPSTTETPAEWTNPQSSLPSTHAPTTSPGEILTLQEIVQPYEMLGSEGSSFTEYAIETCYSRPAGAQPPFETPFASDPIPLDATVSRGDVFLCTIRAEPVADVGDLGLIILDNLGTTAAWGGSDYPEMPFLAAPGLLCREFLADPWLEGWMTEPSYVAIGKPIDAYTLVLAYWFLEGQPARMDVDGNGIPCELLFDPKVVAQVWAGENP